jgi:hypothetical protein
MHRVYAAKKPFKMKAVFLAGKSAMGREAILSHTHETIVAAGRNTREFPEPGEADNIWKKGRDVTV